MSRIDISFERVSEIATKFQGAGQKPSVRLIRAELGGGSNVKIMEFLQRWIEENSLANIAGVEISESFKQSLLAELGRVVKTTKEQYEARLAAEKERTAEALGFMSECEARIAELEKSMAKAKAEHAAEAMTLQKKISTIEEKNSEQTKQLAKLEDNLKSALVAQESAKTDSVTAKVELKRADEVIAKTEKEVASMREKADNFQLEAHKAQVELAATKARLEELKKITKP